MGERAEGIESTEGRRRTGWVALLFLLPALVLLGALVVYPIFFSVARSLFDNSGDAFVGVDNYRTMFASSSTLTAIKNTMIWVVVAPSIVTALGLVFAVLSERVRWSTAFKVVVFMPMAVSFLSAGVTWRLIYEENPNLGLANAAARGIVDVVSPPGELPGARPTDEEQLRPEGEAYVTSTSYAPGETAQLGLVAIRPELVPAGAEAAAAPEPASGAIAGTVWLDFAPGGGGTKGSIDASEQGLPGVEVQAVSGTEVAGSVTTDPDGRFAITDLAAGNYRLRLAATNFREAFGGFSWLGPTLVTPAIIVAYIWIWAGFAMVVIGAGLAAIPREVLEASRVEGASEWQVFRRVTVPLLAPVIGVVLVTLVINVLKIFDLVLVIAPGSAQRTANVIALQMWKTSFGVRDFGLGSALAVFLFVLVIPAMAFNIRRFRAEQ
jgi:alpha-glucoside transport system permease protein